MRNEEWNGRLGTEIISEHEWGVFLGWLLALGDVKPLGAPGKTHLGQVGGSNHLRRIEG
jgi:hypothetical protein